jgi:hypothetical protein
MHLFKPLLHLKKVQLCLFLMLHLLEMKDLILDINLFFFGCTASQENRHGFGLLPFKPFIKYLGFNIDFFSLT